jgi:hypothetical protein
MKKIILLSMLVATVASGQTTNIPGIRTPTGFTPTTNAPGTNVASLPIALPIAVTVDPTNNTVRQAGFWESNAPSYLIQVANATGISKNSFASNTVPGLVMWLHAASINQADGSSVTNWLDISGNGRNATQATSANRPVLHASGINGRPSVTFDGVNDKMQTGSYTWSGDGTNLTVFFVTSSPLQNNSEADYLWSIGGTYGDGVGVTEFTDHLQRAYRSGSGGFGTYQLGQVDNTKPLVETFMFRTGNVDIRHNGVSWGGPPLTAATGLTNSPFYIGTDIDATPGGFSPWHGEIGDILVYSNTLTLAQCQIVESYLMSFYAMPVAQIIFDGDSIDAGYPFTGSNYASQVMANLGGINRWGAVNVGHIADTITGLATNANTRIDPAYRTQRDIVVEGGGSNDVNLGDNTNNIYGNIVAYCKGRQQAGFRVIAQTILPRQNDSTFETKRLQVNAMIRANYLTFADYLADSGGDNILATNAAASANVTLYTDGTHLTQAGNTIKAQYVIAAIKGLLGQTVPPLTATTTSTNYLIGGWETGTTYNNSGASGAATNTLPQATFRAGQQYGLTLLAAQSYAFKASGSDTIRDGANSGTIIFSSTKGNTVQLLSTPDGWYVVSKNGTWTVQ